MSKLSKTIVIVILATACIFVVLFGLFITNIFRGGFGPGTADYHYKLSDKYEVVHAAASEGRGYTRIEKINDTKIIIGNELNGIAWDKNFICARQTKDKDYYWIIELKNDKVYGPFTKEEFKLKKEELGVSKELKLKAPENYSYLEEEQFK